MDLAPLWGLGRNTGGQARLTFSIRLILVTLLLVIQPTSQAEVFCWRTFKTLTGDSRENFRGHVEAAKAEILSRLSQIAYPEVPTEISLHLPGSDPQVIQATTKGLSPGLRDPLIEEARHLKAFEDFKILSDMQPRKVSAEERNVMKDNAQRAAQLVYESLSHLPSGERKNAARRAYLKNYIEAAYSFGGQLQPDATIARPRWRISTGNPRWDHAFDYTENLLPELVRRTPNVRDGSLLPSPYPVLIAAKGRFHESYYWDTYFGVKGLLATGRLELAQMQAENFLHSIQRYGMIPNGMRDYYLSRSQPPFISSLVREVVEAQLKADPSSRPRVMKWLKERALPLLERDYENFWMNSKTRFDPKTGLNHHWDAINFPRPERHSFDVEENLGESYRDVRAAAESGLDFTALHRERASQVATPLLNGMLYKTESDLAYFNELLNQPGETARFKNRASNRKAAMEKMWNPEKGRYEHYDIGKNQPIEGLTAETFVPLFAGMLDPKNPQDMAKIDQLHGTLKQLERPGGLASSDAKDSHHQWDGDSGWAPFQVMAVQGFHQLGGEYARTSQRLATKWVNTIADAHEKHGAMFERMDVATQDKPQVDETKYPTQRGFLWTNGSYAWMLKEVLGVKLVPLAE